MLASHEQDLPITMDVSETQPKDQIKLKDDMFLQNLKVFYSRLFPFKDFHQWLSYSDIQQNYFSNREFSFTLENEIYLRFKSFSDSAQLKSELVKLVPVKMDIGAVYNAKPKDKKMYQPGSFQPLERELIFDIDMTDYDQVRTCCHGADICKLCWDFMTISIKIIDRVIRDDFGFNHLLWVYSGRRGVHCWVCDSEARKLNAEQRKAIVSYIEVVSGGEGQTRKVNLPNSSKITLHPSLRRAQVILDHYFLKTTIESQKMLETQENWSKILQLIPDEKVKKLVDEYFTNTSNLDRNKKWEIICDELKKMKRESVIRDIIFQFCYPRLDDKVSLGINHLLKSPFCIHPKTKRVCVPIDPSKCEQFDPFSVPTLDQLISELENVPLDPTTEDSIPDYEYTSLKPYVRQLKKFNEQMAVEIRKERRLQEEKSLTF